MLKLVNGEIRVIRPNGLCGGYPPRIVTWSIGGLMMSGFVLWGIGAVFHLHGWHSNAGGYPCPALFF